MKTLYATSADTKATNRITTGHCGQTTRTNRHSSTEVTPVSPAMDHSYQTELQTAFRTKYDAQVAFLPLKAEAASPMVR
jgi:hypothetical protein